MKAQRGVAGGRILLGDNTVGGAVMSPIRFHCVRVWISVGLLLCIYMYNQFRLVQNSTCVRLSKRNYCVSRGVSVTAGGKGGELQGQDELKGKKFATLHVHLMLLPVSDPNCELSMPGYNYHELLRMRCNCSFLNPDLTEW